MKCFLILMFFSARVIGQDITSDLVICMPFNGNAQDISGNNNHGITTSSLISTPDRFGNLNSSLSFVGVNSRITVPASNSINNIEINNELTVTIWCKVNSFGATNCFPIVNKYNLNTDWGWDYTIKSNNPWNGQIFVPNMAQMGSNYGLCRGNEGVLTGQWDFYAFTFSRSDSVFRIYKNSILLNTINTSTYTLESTGNGDLYIGYSPAGTDDYAYGSIDDLKIYSRALSSAEIYTIYAGGSCQVALGSENKIEKDLCSVFPNPGSNQLNLIVKMDDEISSEIEIEILSSDGKLVKKQKIKKNDIGNYPIDLKDITLGFYVLKFSSGIYRQNLKFIKE